MIYEQDRELKKLIKEESAKVFKELSAGLGFTQRKLTDTPTDALSVVPKKYVNLNGTVSQRPNSSVASIGQGFFATDTNIPMTYSSTGWRDGVGSIVAQP